QHAQQSVDRPARIDGGGDHVGVVREDLDAHREVREKLTERERDREGAKTRRKPRRNSFRKSSPSRCPSRLRAFAVSSIFARPTQPAVDGAFSTSYPEQTARPLEI